MLFPLEKETFVTQTPINFIPAKSITFAIMRLMILDGQYSKGSKETAITNLSGLVNKHAHNADKIKLKQ